MILLLALFLFQPVAIEPTETSLSVTGLDSSQLEKAFALRPDADFWGTVLRVYLDPPPGPDEVRPHILGNYEVSQGRLRFKPKFPFYPGYKHAVVLDVARITALLTGNPELTPELQRFSFTPKAELQSPVARVEWVTPQAKIVPANTLKYYLHFSHAMERGQVNKFIRLVDEQGKEVDGAFLHQKPELWDRENKRLTLLFDPGRIKRALRRHLEKGPPMRPGRKYSLIVDGQMTDWRGVPMVETFRHSFETGPADRQSPDPMLWQINVPNAQEPLVLTFNEGLDSALAMRMIQVVTASGQLVPGKTRLDDDETRWSFEPREPWLTGEYRIEINPNLEDRAGNTLHRLFDEPMQRDVDPNSRKQPTVLNFRVN